MPSLQDLGFTIFNHKPSALDDQNDNTDQTFPPNGISGNQLEWVSFNKIVAGEMRVNESMQSADYVALTSGWKIWSDADGVGYIDAQNIIAGSYIQVFRQDAVPTSIHIGDLWVDTDDGNKLYVALSVGADQITAGEWVDASDEAIATAQAAAEAAQGDATTALGELDDIALDTKITPVEKLTAKPLWDAIVAEKADIDTQADTYSVSKTAYGTAYTNLNTYLNTTITVFDSMTTTTTITRSAWDGFWEAYYNAKVEILQAIADATALLAAWDGVTGADKPEDNADVSPNFPSDENLVGYWSLDEGSGSKAYDGSGNGLDGVLTNMEEGDWIDGVVGKALDFGGTDEYIELGDNFPLVTTTGTYSISLWFKVTDISASGTLINISPGAASGDRNGINIYSSRIQAGYWNGSAYVGKKTAALSTESEDVWIHVVLVNTAGTITLYVNNVAQTTSGMSRLNQENHIAQNAGTALTGKVDEVRIYGNKALTAKEVSALYKYPAGNKGLTVPIGHLTSGSIYSKQITLAVAAGTGDTYIAGGNALDLANWRGGDANGGAFILGLDDSVANDPAKFFIGNYSTNDYLSYDPTNKLRIVASGENAITIEYGSDILLKHGGDIKFTSITAPTTCTATLVATDVGNVDAGTHTYRVTYVNDTGETELGAVSNEITTDATHLQVDLSGIPVSSLDGVTQRKIYRTKANTTNYYLLTTIANNTETTYTDNTADASLTGEVANYKENDSFGKIIIDGIEVLNLGSWNTFVGYESGFSNTAGYKNSILGTKALYTNTTGYANLAIGHRALYLNTTGYSNSAMGYEALYRNTTGHHNSAMGIAALYYNTVGCRNTAVGCQALYSNSNGNYNVAIGDYSLYSNSIGENGNIGLGYYSGKYETGSNAFYVNNQNRTNTAGDKAKSILYGVMATAAANQKLTINALLNLSVPKTPASAAAAGVAGDVCWDTSYIYVCVATDSWKRVAIAAW